MIKKTITITLTSLLLLGACKSNKYPGYEETGTGAYFKTEKNGDEKQQIHEGDVVFIRHIMMTDKDSVLYDYKVHASPGRPYAVRVNKPKYQGDMFEMLMKMHLHDSASFMLRVDSMFSRYYHSPAPAYIDSNGYIIYHVVIDSVITSAKVDSIEKIQQQMQMTMMENARLAEDSLIKKYLEDNKITVKPTASGLYIVSKQKGKGPKVNKGDSVEVNYKGMLTNGQIFDASDRHDQAFIFVAGGQQVIPAWDETILTMGVGDKVLLIAPSAAAYGPNGSGPIPPYSPLVFEMEIISKK